MENKALHIHIPFINKETTYLESNDISRQLDKASQYIDNLINEIDKNKDEKYNSIFIGGRSPLVIDNTLLDKLLTKLDMFEAIEFSIESPVIDLTDEKIEILKKHKVNRVSIKVMSVDDEIIKILEQKHTKADVTRVIKNLKANGIKNINLDFLYAFKKQTQKNLEYDLEFASKADVEHLSFYELEVKETNKNLFLMEQVPAVFNKMYLTIFETLEKAGFKRYETCHFAKEPKYRSLQLYIYWNCFEWLSLGWKGDSFFTDSDGNWWYGTQEGDLLNHKQNAHKMDELEAENVAMMVGLGQVDGIENVNKLQEHAIELNADLINDLINDGYLVRTPKGIKVPTEMFDQMDEVLANFVGDYDEEGELDEI